MGRIASHTIFSYQHVQHSTDSRQPKLHLRSCGQTPCSQLACLDVFGPPVVQLRLPLLGWFLREANRTTTVGVIGGIFFREVT